MDKLIKDHNPELSSKCMNIVKCDTARISKAGDNIFLFIGFNRNTKDDSGQWVEIDSDGNKKSRDWDYIQESVVASGKTEDELIKSAKEYKRLCGMTVIEYLTDKANEKV